MADRRVIARFHPQAWINNYAVEVDPEGPVEFDVTDAVLAMSRAEAWALADDDYDTDFLRELSTAPEWIRDWRGPFRVEVADAVRAFLCETFAEGK